MTFVSTAIGLCLILILSPSTVEGYRRWRWYHSAQTQNASSCPQMELLRGRDGRDGRDGMMGLPGAQGQKGESGPVGQTGLKGDKGNDGATGPAGSAGQRGIQGQPGFVGLPGPTGPTGDIGAPGMKGQKGEQGAAGSPGQDGVKGSAGERGATGQKGDEGFPGFPGNPGPAGPTGQTGVQGPPGPQGSRANCGQVYTRWGRSTCPGGISTDLLYSGNAGGSAWFQTGGATNYLCMPNNPDYLQLANMTSEGSGHGFVYGSRYSMDRGQPLNTLDDHTALCAVCMATSRCSLLMIPAKTQCPSSWTTEYVGYLMSARQDNSLPTKYECVDRDATRGDSGDRASVVFTHVRAQCSSLDCPPYDGVRELTCVVCTR